MMRREAGSYVGPRVKDGSTSTFTILASVRPVDGDDMELVPSGRREMETFCLYTSTRLRPAAEEDSADAANADIVTIDSQNYEVLTVKRSQSKLISHYKCIVSKI